MTLNSKCMSDNNDEVYVIIVLVFSDGNTFYIYLTFPFELRNEKLRFQGLVHVFSSAEYVAKHSLHRIQSQAI